MNIFGRSKHSQKQVVEKPCVVGQALTALAVDQTLPVVQRTLVTQLKAAYDQNPQEFRGRKIVEAFRDLVAATTNAQVVAATREHDEQLKKQREEANAEMAQLVEKAKAVDARMEALARHFGHAAMAAWLTRIRKCGWTTYLSEPRYALVVLRELVARGRARRLEGRGRRQRTRKCKKQKQLLDFVFPGGRPRTPRFALVRRQCDVCNLQRPLSEEAFPICDACELRRYCSHACQRIDWLSGHRDICTFDTDAKAATPALLRLPDELFSIVVRFYWGGGP